jgi:putative spermidine/putrescine transport system permease protein
MWQMTKISHQLNKCKGLLGILPALLFMLIFFLGGTLHSLSLSLENQESFSLVTQDEKFWAYKELINGAFFQSIGVTVGIAAVVALFSGVTGLIAALFLVERSRHWKWLNIIFQLPVGIPHLLSAYLFMQVFMQSGWYSRIAYHLGWIDSIEAFPVLVHD